MPTTDRLRATLALWRHPRRTLRARNAWCSAEDDRERAWAGFADATNPETRAQALADVAAALDDQATTHADAWGPDPLPGQPASDQAGAYRAAARMVRWVALTEPHTAETGPFVDIALLAAEQGQPIPPARLCRALNALTCTADPRWRHALADELAEDAAAEYGAAAASELAPLITAYRRLAEAAPPITGD